MLINLRNALMAGKRLPYDAEVEYLESTGTQWIDTGIIGGSSSKVEISASSSNTAQNMGLFGSRNTSFVKAFTIWQRATNTSVRFDFADDTTNRVIANAAWDTSGVNTVIKDGLNNTLNGVAGANNATATFTCEYPFYLFSINTAGTATSNASARVYSCRIYDNNTLVRDFIPVRKGAVGYLYDRVSGKLFGNAGTGDFVLGQDVVPVEWLETTGNQYIDTRVTCGSTDTTVFEFDQSYSALQSGRFIWGSNYGANQGKDANNYYVCGMNRSDVVMQAGVVYHCKTQVAPDNAIKAYINGTLFRDNTGSSAYTNPFYIFRLGGFNGAEGRPSYLRIHHLTVSINNAHVRSFRPVRVGTDATSWEGAMMDVLTRRIYRNAGTGAFTYGNDLKYPIPAE